MSQTIDCSVPACGKPSRKLGYCHAHYRRHRLGQPMDTPVRAWGLGQPCSRDDCDKPAKGRGLCPAHYKRWRLGEPLDKPLRRRRAAGATCEVDGCNRGHRANGFCSMHLQRIARTGVLGCAESTVAPAGSGYINPDGYRVFRVAGKDILEHRAVMERLLGRALEAFETVHHKNGIRHDNGPANLELWTKPQPAGQRAVDLVDWVIDHYADLVEVELAKKRGITCP